MSRRLPLTGSPDHVSTLSRPGTMSRIRPVIRDGGRRGQPSCRGFPSPFGCRRSRLGHPIPAGGLGLPYGRLTGHDRPDPDGGLPRFARTSCDWGGCLLNPEDGGALPAEKPPQSAPAASQRPVLAPRYDIPPSRAYLHEASTEVYAIHPSSLPLACNPWMEQGSSSFCLSSEPRRGRRRRTSDRAATSTGLELRIRHSSNLLSSCSLVSCDLVSQGI